MVDGFFVACLKLVLVARVEEFTRAVSKCYETKKGRTNSVMFSSKLISSSNFNCITRKG